MPRIAYISSTFPDYQKCGTGMYAGFVTEALAQQGHDVHVVTSAIPEIRPTFGKVTVHKIMSDWNLFDIPKLVQLFFQIKPEIIHINHPTAIAGARSKILVNILPEMNKAMWKLPLVTTIHEFSNNSLLGKIKVLPMLMSSDAITVTNERYREKMIKFLPKGHEKKIHVVNIGSQFRPGMPEGVRSDQRTRYGLAPDDKVLGFMGFITPPKGFHNLIDAVAPLMKADPKLKLLALSSWNQSKPTYRHQILEKIEKHQITSQVIFTGFLEDPDLWQALTAVDLCVFAFDQPVEERSSGPLRQTLFKGLPTMVYAEDLNYQEFGLKHGENIWFTPLKDIDALRRDISKLINDAPLLKKLSQGAHDLLPYFSFDALSNSMSRIYSDLLMRRG